MTKYELNRILLDEERLSLDKIKDILYELKDDCVKVGETNYESGFYNGEVNAFYIALDLLAKLEVPNDKN